METKMTCCVTAEKNKCKGAYYGWIDVRHPKSKEFDYCRLPFCKKHFKKVMSFANEKEKEMQKKEGKNYFWVCVPYKVVKEALNK